MALCLSATSGSAATAGKLPEISGVHPHLAMANAEGECGIGAVVPWAGRLWVITYGPHLPNGSSDRLWEIDAGLGRLLPMLGPRDLLVITGDHGNDPTIGHDKHTREFTPLLAYGERVAGRPLAARASLADIAATIADNFGVDPPEIGKSFLGELADVEPARERAAAT